MDERKKKERERERKKKEREKERKNKLTYVSIQLRKNAVCLMSTNTKWKITLSPPPAYIDLGAGYFLDV
jgi:hypothetical protein